MARLSCTVDSARNPDLEEVFTAPTIVVNAQAGNDIVVDFASPVASAEMYIAELVEAATMLDAAAAAFKMAETGAGAEVSDTALPKLVFTTDGAGSAQVTVTDAAPASGKEVFIFIRPVLLTGEVGNPAAHVVDSLTFA